MGQGWLCGVIVTENVVTPLGGEGEQSVCPLRMQTPVYSVPSQGEQFGPDEQVMVTLALVLRGTKVAE